MSTINNKAEKNIEIILNLKEDDTLISQRGNLLINNEYDQVNNINDIEYGIILTFYNFLTEDVNKEHIYNKDLFNKLDQCIDNIFSNKNLNKMIEDDSEFHELIDDIDMKIELIRDNYYYQSPFFTAFKKIYDFKKKVYDIYMEHNMYISKIMGIVNRDFHNEYYQSCSDDDDDDDKEVDDNEVDDKEVDDNEVDDNEVDDNEEKDPITGEVNPNLIYEDEKKEK